ncbi:hypothetical protein [Hoeflea sp.]|nr:hypothetical protein [Hoeflea sp.]
MKRRDRHGQGKRDQLCDGIVAAHHPAAQSMDVLSSLPNLAGY